LGEYDADYPLDPGLEEALVSSKLDAIHSEYNQLLTSQLDSQRRYFERLMAVAEAEREGAATAAAAAKERAAAVASAVDDARDARRNLKEAHEKLDAEMGRRAKVEEERDFLRSLNDTLLANQRAFEEKTRALERDAEASAREKDARIRNLEEQVRDLMVFLDAQSKVQEAVGGDGGTIAGGSVVGVGEGDEGPSRDAAHARLQKKLAGRRREKHAETRG
jgi:BRCA1-associated protein